MHVWLSDVVIDVDLAIDVALGACVDVSVAVGEASYTYLLMQSRGACVAVAVTVSRILCVGQKRINGADPSGDSILMVELMMLFHLVQMMLMISCQYNYSSFLFFFFFAFSFYLFLLSFSLSVYPPLSNSCDH